jgi:hypothetical protein
MIVNNTNKTIRLKKNGIVASANKIEKVNLVSDKLQRCDEKVDKFDMSEIKFLKHLDETLLLKLGRIKIFLQRLIKTWVVLIRLK